MTALKKIWAETAQPPAVNGDATSASKRRARRPVSIRFSEEEWSALDRASGDMPVGTYVRRKALDGLEVSRKTPYRRRTRHRMPRSDEAALSRMLGELGRSRVSSNLNQLARAANLGTLIVDPDVVQALTEACAEVKAIRAELIRALGLKAED
jgi:hypothetical protein